MANKTTKKKMNEKEWTKIIGYMVPVIALVAANFLQLEDTTELESSLMVVFTAIMGVLTAVGVIANNDKCDEEQQ